MVLINYATKEIVAKVVYYGPALCGKTTNLQYIYTKLNPKKRGKMISLATESDRTLFFDFLPMELGKVQGFKIRFQLYTVPGQVFYGATRKLVLKGADAIVFVADSQEATLDMNIESIQDMKQNLIENNLDPETIPLVIQYNKRDLNGIMEVEDLEKTVNWRGVPHTEAVAITGPGVMDTFKEITKALIDDLRKKHSLMGGDAIKELPPEMFEEYEPRKEKEDEVLAAEDVVFEIEHGSGYRDESEEGEVVSGELLDMVETISLADATQAEAFFDNVRQGTSANEAMDKVMSGELVEDSIELSDSGQEAEIIFERQENYDERGERELTPDELEFAETAEAVEATPEEAVEVVEAEQLVEEPLSEETSPRKEKPSKPAPAQKRQAGSAKKEQPKPSTAPDASETDRKFDAVQDTLAKLAVDVASIGARVDKTAAGAGTQPAGGADMSALDRRFDEIQEMIAKLAIDVATIGAKVDRAASGGAAGVQGAEIDTSSIDRRFEGLQGILARMSEGIGSIEDRVAAGPAAQPAAPADLSGIDRRFEELQETVVRLAMDVTEMSAKLDRAPSDMMPSGASSSYAAMPPELDDIRESQARIEQEVSALRMGLTLLKEATSNMQAGASGGDLKAVLDEFRQDIMKAFEGQDRLLLSILEASRETKLANTDAHEKLEDAIRYIANALQGGEGGKKKWF